MCPACGQPLDRCECGRNSALPKGDGIVRISRETKGRKGKTVTLISGISLNTSELKLLARDLKITCGSGGTVKDGIIEIQGDHRDLLKRELTQRGWTVL
jgi:translation initiation factor 1